MIRKRTFIVTENPLLGLSSILVLGVAGQWLAWRLRLPSILLLLLFGFIVGPLTHWLEPDLLLGDLLFPLVSLSVAVILFEGGLSLNLAELHEIRRVVWRLISIGVLVTWVISALAAYCDSGPGAFAFGPAGRDSHRLRPNGRDSPAAPCAPDGAHRLHAQMGGHSH